MRVKFILHIVELFLFFLLLLFEGDLLIEEEGIFSLEGVRFGQKGRMIPQILLLESFSVPVYFVEHCID